MATLRTFRSAAPGSARCRFRRAREFGFMEPIIHASTSHVQHARAAIMPYGSMGYARLLWQPGPSGERHGFPTSASTGGISLRLLGSTIRTDRLNFESPPIPLLSCRQWMHFRSSFLSRILELKHVSLKWLDVGKKRTRGREALPEHLHSGIG